MRWFLEKQKLSWLPGEIEISVYVSLRVCLWVLVSLVFVCVLCVLCILSVLCVCVVWIHILCVLCVSECVQCVCAFSSHTELHLLHLHHPPPPSIPEEGSHRAPRGVKNLNCQYIWCCSHIPPTHIYLVLPGVTSDIRYLISIGSKFHECWVNSCWKREEPQRIPTIYWYFITGTLKFSLTTHPI